MKNGLTPKDLKILADLMVYGDCTPYLEGREIGVDLIVEFLKKKGAPLTKRKEKNFRKACNVIS